MSLLFSGSSEVIESAKDSLQRKLYTAAHGVSCDYCNGVLYLAGRSNSFYEKQMAQEVVLRLDGVQRIENQLQVSWT